MALNILNDSAQSGKADKQWLIFDKAPAAFFTLTTEGIINKVNISGSNMLGLKKSDLINKVFSQFILNQDLKRFKLCRVNLVESRNNQSCEVRVFKSDGSIIYTKIDLSIIKNRNVDEILLVITDISYQKQIEDTQTFLLGINGPERNKDFFAILSRHLADTLKVDYVCIDKLINSNEAETLAVYYDGHFEDNIKYTLKDTPCGKLLGNKVCSFSSNVRVLFPKDQILQDMQAESYIGITLWGTNGMPIGLIALISRKPIENISIAETLLKQVSIRAAAELEFRLIMAKVNRIYTALEKSSIAMRDAVDEDTLLNKVCHIIAEDCGFAMVWIGYALEDEERSIVPVASAGFDEGYLDTLKLTWFDSERGQGPSGRAIRTGEISICRNMLTDPKFKPWREEALKRGYASSIVFPLISSERVFGAIALYSKEADSFKDDEIKLLSRLTNDLAHGIIALRLRHGINQVVSGIIKK